MIQPLLKQDVITEKVRNWILQGKYRPGDRLPTNIELAEFFGVNTRTVAAGLSRLVSEGLIERAPKRGTIVRRKIKKITSNCVPLVAMTEGHLYSNIAHVTDALLQREKLFPIVIAPKHFNCSELIQSFFERIALHQQPFGYLIDGEMSIPYSYIIEHAAQFVNSVFIFTYHRKEKIPFAKYVLVDFDTIGVMAAEYFAARGVKNILFPALNEPSYRGPGSSNQELVMHGLARRAAELGINFDEGFFWRLHAGAPLEDLLSAKIRNNEVEAIFCYTDFHVLKTVDILRRNGVASAHLLGNMNTPHAVKYGIPSFDWQVDKVMETAVNMLIGNDLRNDVKISPLIAENDNGIDVFSQNIS